MPVTLSGSRETSRHKLPLEVLEPLAEAIIDALFAMDESKLNSLCNAFVREIGLNDEVKLRCVPKSSISDYTISLEFSTTFMGVDHAKTLATQCVYRHKPAMADNINKGAAIMTDIMSCIELFMFTVFKSYTYKDRDALTLYNDAVFKMGMKDWM